MTAKKKVWILDGGSPFQSRKKTPSYYWITGQMLTADGGHTRH